MPQFSVPVQQVSPHTSAQASAVQQASSPTSHTKSLLQPVQSVEQLVTFSAQPVTSWASMIAEIASSRSVSLSTITAVSEHPDWLQDGPQPAAAMVLDRKSVV